MPAPIYFLPGLTKATATRERIASRRLADVVRDCGPHELPVLETPTLGPNDLAGVYVCPLLPGAEPPINWGRGKAEERLNWLPAGDGTELWIGLDRQLGVQPADLLRPGRLGSDGKPTALHPGYVLALGDGNTWEIPVVRRPNLPGIAPTDLPRTWGWTPENEFEERIDPRYQAAWDASEPLCGFFFDTDTPNKLPYPVVADLCLLALSLNYRFTRDLQNRLNVIRSDNWWPILQAMVDWPFVRDVLATLKKTTSVATPASLPDMLPGTLGAEADCQAIAPAAASCT